MVDRSSWNAIKGELRKIANRMRLMVTRAKVVASAVTGGGQIAAVDMLQGIRRDGAEVFEPYGISSYLPPGSEGIAIAVGASGDQVAILGAAPRGAASPDKLPGEVDYYSEHGQVIRLHTDGSISLSPAPLGFVYTGGAVDPTKPYAAGGGDSVVPSAQFVAWMGAVNALLPPGTPLPVVTGTIAPVATRKTKVG